MLTTTHTIEASADPQPNGKEGREGDLLVDAALRRLLEANAYRDLGEQYGTEGSDHPSHTCIL